MGKAKGVSFREEFWTDIKFSGEKCEHIISSMYVRPIIQARDRVIGEYVNLLILIVDGL